VRKLRATRRFFDHICTFFAYTLPVELLVRSARPVSVSAGVYVRRSKAELSQILAPISVYDPATTRAQMNPPNYFLLCSATTASIANSAHEGRHLHMLTVICTILLSIVTMATYLDHVDCVANSPPVRKRGQGGDSCSCQ